MAETPFGPQGTLIGKSLGDYELIELLTSGGMARIYKGFDVRLQRFAAVKVLMRELLDSDESLPERFMREARAVAQLDHPNIVSVYQTGEQDGYMFIAMRLIEGNDLADEITRLRRLGQMMDPRRAIAILEQVADALDYAHARGIIHRDFKPSNVLLDAQDRAYLTDFGLALWQSKDKTMGTAFGTPRYIAPEQALASETAVPASDIYAMAVVLYEILTGDMLFRADTPMQIALSHISEPPPSPRLINPGVPEGVERELLKALAKDAKSRHQTAGEFISAVKAAYASVDASYAEQSPARPPSEPVSDQVSTVIIPEARTPLSQRMKVPSPVPRKTRWPLVIVAFAILLLGLLLGMGLIFDAIRDRADSNATATAEQALVIAALSATHTPSDTPTPTGTDTPSATFTATDTQTPTDTASPTPSATDTEAPAASGTDAPLPSGTAAVADAATTEARQNRATDRAVIALAETGTARATDTEPPSDGPTPAAAGTETPSLTATDAASPTASATRTTAATATDTATPGDTETPTVTATNTRQPTASNTRRPSPTPLPTETATLQPTFTPSVTPTDEGVVVTESTPLPTSVPVVLSIRYDVDFFVVRAETADADVSALTFIRDDMPAMRLGGSVPLRLLETGRCSVIQQERRTFDLDEYQCPDPIDRLTNIPSASVFWRGSSDSFEVRLGDRVLAECPLVARTQTQTCEAVLR